MVTLAINNSTVRFVYIYIYVKGTCLVEPVEIRVANVEGVNIDHVIISGMYASVTNVQSMV